MKQLDTPGDQQLSIQSKNLGQWQCMGTFLVVTVGCDTSSQWVEIKNAAKHPQMHRTAPTAEHGLALTTTSAEVGKPWGGEPALIWGTLKHLKLI